jgi:uncharacterized membrane protein
VRTLVAVLLVPFALAALVGTVLLFPFDGGPESQGGAGRPVHGVITATETGSCSGQVQVGEQPDAPQCLVVTVRMTDGAASGQNIRVVVPQEPSTPRFAVDDEVVLSYGGSDPRQSSSYQLVDFQRDVPLALLAGLFAVAVLVLGRWQGLKALVALGLSFLVLVFFVLPAILAGESPLLVAICGAGVIMFAVLYLTHGFSARTSTAVLGTMVSLAMIGVLGALWAAFAKLTGLDEETATLVGLLNAPIDTRGLLLAGVVIGALGVLDDVTVTQTSAVWELRAANPLLTRGELYTSALRIGRDHVASAVNTLVMAYAGAALPLLLYSSISGVGLGSILTSQSIAQELVRTLVGSIGLVAAVPITTALAAAMASQEPATLRRAPRRADREDAEQGERPARHPERDGRRTARDADRPEKGGGRRTAREPDRAERDGGRRPTSRRVERAERSAGRGAESPEKGSERPVGRRTDRTGERVAGRPRGTQADPGTGPASRRQGMVDRTLDPDLSGPRRRARTAEPGDRDSRRSDSGRGTRRRGAEEPLGQNGTRASRGQDSGVGPAVERSTEPEALRARRRDRLDELPGRSGESRQSGATEWPGKSHQPRPSADGQPREPATDQGQRSWFEDDMDD